MAISGSPKKMAQDIAEGFLSLSPPMLKAYVPADFKTVLANLAVVARELRQEQFPPDDVMGIKGRNMKLSRVSQAETVVRAYCRKHRIPI